MGDLRQRITPRARKAAAGLAAGKPIRTALLEAGYSDWHAKHGKDALTAPIMKALAEERKSAAADLIATGKAFTIEDQKNLLTGRLIVNNIDGKDSGSISAKILGSRRELNLWTPDVQQGIVIINPPAAVAADPSKIIDSEE